MWQRAQVTQASETTIQDVPLALVTLIILSALELTVWARCCSNRRPSES